MEEEPLDVDSFFNDNPDDTITLPHSSPAIEKNEQKGTAAIDKNEQKGKFYSLISYLSYSIILILESLFNYRNG